MLPVLVVVLLAVAGLLALLLLAVLSSSRLAAVRPAPSPAAEQATEADPVVRLPIEEAIDLHGFRPRDIPDVVRSYLEEAHRLGLREVRLIHGRGKGVQRQRVRALLARHPLVERYGDAPAHRGGWGATVAVLRSEAAGSKAARPASGARR